MMPYLSLFAHESHRKLCTSDPVLASLLSRDVEEIVARSRHSLKLFEDTNRRVAGQVTYFRDQLVPTHTRRFMGNTWLSMARILEKDLGLFSYDGRLILSTHAANFLCGIEPQALFTKSWEELRAIYKQYGRYFARLGAQLHAQGNTFLRHLNSRRFNQWPKDVRAATYYSRVFDGAENLNVNALLTVFRGMMNFATQVITAGMDTSAVEYTVFKIRFLTLYQILGSLQAMYDEQHYKLTSRSMTIIEQIIRTPDTQLIMARAAKPFRNTLVHYNLDARVDTTQVNVNQPIFGLVPIYFPCHDALSFSSLIGRCMTETAVARQGLRAAGGAGRTTAPRLSARPLQWRS
jgi:hypothetical protein